MGENNDGVLSAELEKVLTPAFTQIQNLVPIFEFQARATSSLLKFLKSTTGTLQRKVVEYQEAYHSTRHQLEQASLEIASLKKENSYYKGLHSHGAPPQATASAAYPTEPGLQGLRVAPSMVRRNSDVPYVLPIRPASSGAGSAYRNTKQPTADGRQTGAPPSRFFDRSQSTGPMALPGDKRNLHSSGGPRGTLQDPTTLTYGGNPRNTQQPYRSYPSEYDAGHQNFESARPMSSASTSALTNRTPVSRRHTPSSSPHFGGYPPSHPAQSVPRSNSSVAVSAFRDAQGTTPGALKAVSTTKQKTSRLSY
ncbi:hypothetical protein HDV03_002173 [Kappamyces sp. JEL0829]|nr:hypothetical protein HDV03_002173 [Kappamyces sp. JEL0829]